MNRNDLYQSFAEVDADILERSEKNINEKLKSAHLLSSTRRTFWKKFVAIAAVIAVIFTVSIPALAAADVNFAYKAIYFVSPYLAQKLKPVQKFCTSNGIKMEVVSASIKGDTAEVLVAMNDLEQDRIDETIDLFDSYDIRDSYDLSGTCRLEHYDTATGTAYFYILLQQMDKIKFSGDKITFSISKFLSHKSNYSGILSDIDLSQIDMSPTIDNNVEIRGGSWLDRESENVVFLKPSANALSSPMEGVDLTALGYVDGELHIQMYYHDIIKTDNHGWLSLVSANGNTLEAKYSECFWDESYCGSYQEYVFHLPKEALDTYQVYGEFTTCGQLTKGDWEITFQLSDVQQ